MAEITLRQALQKGLSEAIENDPDVFIMGEDIGAYGGAYAICLLYTSPSPRDNR